MTFEILSRTIFSKNQRRQFRKSISRTISFNELAGGANDIIVVEKEDAPFNCTPLSIVIGKLSSSKTIFKSRSNGRGEIFVNGNHVLKEIKLKIGKSGVVYIKRHKKSFYLSTDELKTMHLDKGINHAFFIVEDLNIKIHFAIYLIPHSSKFIISDIDGTITKSDFRGFVGGNLGFDVHHRDVVRFLHNVYSNGYNVIYLSARPVAFDQGTREYLFEHLQNSDGGYSLPRGPLFLNPTPTDCLGVTDPSIIKTSILNIVLGVFQSDDNIIVGAFGNKETDTIAYRNVGIPPENIFLLDKESKIVNVGTEKECTYTELANTVNMIYPKRGK